MIGADSNYSINPWMRPEERLGDTDETMPPLALGPEEVISGLLSASPVPPAAGYQPRLLGAEQMEPGIVDVLNVGPAVLMRDTPTSQDSGQPGTLRNSNGVW